MYFRGVFYSDHTCPDVIFHFWAICIHFHVCVSFWAWEVHTYVVVFGWILLILLGISTFFNSFINAFVGLPLEIALMFLYRCIACSMGIIPEIAKSLVWKCFVSLCYKNKEGSLDLLQFAFSSVGHRDTPGIWGVCDGWEYGIFVDRHQIVEWHTPCGFWAADKAVADRQQLVFQVLCVGILIQLSV